ncbi:hypothetical protein L195_g032609, partial [Trifolium pratense]
HQPGVLFEEVPGSWSLEEEDDAMGGATARNGGGGGRRECVLRWELEGGN